MIFVSYAQNYEDVMLHRALKDVDRGFYIDVGANDPVVDSVTKAFYESGWQGINIDPVSEWIEALQNDRPNDTNLQVAAGDREGSIRFYEVVGTGLSSVDELIAKEHAKKHGFELNEYEVPLLKLTSICEQYVSSDIHFLKIDVEGAEAIVLKGLNLHKIRPWIILVESTRPNTQIESHEEWEQSITERGYHFVYFDGINRFYVADECKHLDAAFAVPPNYFDHFKRVSEFRLELQVQGLQNELDLALIDLGKLRAKMVDFSRSKTLENQEGVLQSLITKMGEVVEEVPKRLIENSQLDSALTDSKMQLERLEDKIDKLRLDGGLIEDQLREKNINIDRLDRELRRVNEENSELHHVGHRWWSEAERLNAELKLVYGSNSWAVTWPFRKSKVALGGVGSVTYEFVPKLKGIAYQLLYKSLDMSLKNPRIKALGIRCLRRVPKLESRIRGVLHSRRMSDSHVLASSNSVDVLEDITPRANEIFIELKQALQSVKGSEE